MLRNLFRRLRHIKAELRELVDAYATLTDEKKITEQMMLFTPDVDFKVYMGGQLVSDVKGIVQLEKEFNGHVLAGQAIFHLERTAFGERGRGCRIRRRLFPDQDAARAGWARSAYRLQREIYGHLCARERNMAHSIPRIRLSVYRIPSAASLIRLSKTSIRRRWKFLSSS